MHHWTSERGVIKLLTGSFYVVLVTPPRTSQGYVEGWKWWLSIFTQYQFSAPTLKTLLIQHTHTHKIKCIKNPTRSYLPYDEIYHAQIFAGVQWVGGMRIQKLWECKPRVKKITHNSFSRTHLMESKTWVLWLRFHQISSSQTMHWSLLPNDDCPNNVLSNPLNNHNFAPYLLDMKNVYSLHFFTYH